MTEALGRGIDLLRVTASLMLDVPVDQVSDQQRSIIKEIVYGSLTGRGKRSIWRILVRMGIDVSFEDVKDLLQLFWKEFSDAKKYKERARELACEVSEGRTRMGRRRILTSDPALPSEEVRRLDDLFLSYRVFEAKGGKNFLVSESR